MQKTEKMLDLLRDKRWHDYDEILRVSGFSRLNSISLTLEKLKERGFVFDRRNIWGVRSEARLISEGVMKIDSRSLICSMIQLCNGKGCYRSQGCPAYEEYRLSRFAHTLGLKNANQNRKQSDNNLRII